MKNKMKVWLPLLVMFAALVFACSLKETAPENAPSDEMPSSSQKKQDDRFKVIYQARDRVMEYFHPLNGEIEDRQDGEVRVRLQEEDHVKKGMRLSVFREGEPFYHPVTNELIGRAEDLVGRIEVEDGVPADGLYACTIVSGDVRAHDKARISSSKIKIAFFQDRRADWDISEAFYESLKDSGRFEIVESYAPDYEPATLSGLARNLGAEASLMFSSFMNNGERGLRIQLYWAGDGTQFGNIEENIGRDLGVSASGEEFIPAVDQTGEPWRTFTLHAGLMISSGDVDGDGNDEIAVSDGNDIRIYKMKDDLREVWKIESGQEGKHLSLDVLDLNGNGRAELFVTAMENVGILNTADNDLYRDDLRLNSFVIEYDPREGYRTIQKHMPYFLRVSGGTLLMQGFNATNIFSGPVYKGEWIRNSYRRGDQITLPEGVTLNGFTFIDWKNDGHEDIITYDDRGYLRLYARDGTLKWKSDGSYGPSPFTFSSRTRSFANPTVKWSVRARLEVLGTDHGPEVIAVGRNPLLSSVPGLGTTSADVYTLRWDGAAMEENVILKDVSGSITDYCLHGRDLFLLARSDIFMFIEGMAEGELSKNSILYYYSFTPSESSPYVKE